MFRSFCIAFAGFVFAAIGYGQDSAERSDRSGRHPNVLFIAVDDLRPSIGCYGDSHAITPNIDRLAQSGVRFDRAYCQVAVCNPSRASLMTGLRPDKLGVWTLPIHFREAMPAAITLPQWFRKHGYAAIGHGKIFHNPTPDPQSWSEPIRTAPRMDSPYPKGTPERIEKVQQGLAADDWRKRNLRGPSTAAPDVSDSELIDGARTDMAIEDLKRLAKSDQPFFLAMGYVRPHLAWIAPKKYWDLHDPDLLPVVLDGKVTTETPAYALSNSYELTHYVDLIDFPKPWDEEQVEEAQARHLMHAYYSCVSYVDAQIGRLLDGLQQAGLRDSTIVVLWSDHGWKLGEFNGWGKMTNYEIDTRVPLIISAPSIQRVGTSTDELAELLDLFPTLCDLAGIATPDFVDGESLMPALKNPDDEHQTAAYSQYFRRAEGSEYMGYAIRTKQYRFVEWRDFGSGEVKARELYDHDVDLGESTNLAANSNAELIDRLTEQLLESHPRRPLTLIPSVHSNASPNRQRADLTLANRSESELMVYPITSQGRRGRKRQIPVGESLTFKARIGGVYVVESRNGKIHEIHSPSFPQSVVNITSPDSTSTDSTAAEQSSGVK